MLKISVLDQSPVHDGKSPSEALKDTIKLAKLCEKWGYFRYWLAEHHDTPGYASASPEIMVSAVANATKSMRVGSGGVMLNHYSPYKVAECFATLNALHVNRIDLGIGRASGANFLASRALHNANSGDYQSKAYYLKNFLDDSIAEDDYFNGVHVSPKNSTSLPIYLLGSSDGSSELAGVLGCGFCLALFIGTHKRDVSIMQKYRSSFQKSKNFAKPKAMIAVACICADTKEQAKSIASSHTFWKVQAFRQPVREGLKSKDEVKKIYENLSDEDKAYYYETLDTMILGTPKECKSQIQALAKKYEVDEVIIVNVTYSFEDRVRSYELLAKEFNLA